MDAWLGLKKVLGIGSRAVSWSCTQRSGQSCMQLLILDEEEVVVVVVGVPPLGTTFYLKWNIMGKGCGGGVVPC